MKTRPGIQRCDAHEHLLVDGDCKPFAQRPTNRLDASGIMLPDDFAGGKFKVPGLPSSGSKTEKAAKEETIFIIRTPAMPGVLRGGPVKDTHRVFAEVFFIEGEQDFFFFSTPVDFCGKG